MRVGEEDAAKRGYTFCFRERERETILIRVGLRRYN